MQAFCKLNGLVAPLDRSNVDTDAIIPKQFLKSIKRTGFGPNLFDEWRYLDHGEIVQIAHQRLVSKLDYSTIAFQLAPELFTLSELQRVYEIILGDSLDKRNFRKRILALEHVEETDQFRKNRAHRPARLYLYSRPNELHYVK